MAAGKSAKEIRARLRIGSICPVCGEQLIHRDDDKPETIAKRLSVYHSQTAPLIGYYTDNGKIRTVDGSKKPEEVLSDILSALE